MFSEWYAGLLFVCLAIVLAIVGIRLVRRKFSPELLQRHNDVAGPIHATLGVVYAVLLAFVVVTVWEDFKEAETAVTDEAAQLFALYRDVGGLPDSIQKDFRTSITAYITSVVEHEWPQMARNNVQTEVRHYPPYYTQLWQDLHIYVPANKTEEIWFHTLVEKMDKLENARLRRMLSAESKVPTTMWVLLIFGGIITILFACLFGADNAKLHTFMVTALAAAIAFTLFTIAAIDHPFIGVVRVEPEAFEHLLMSVGKAS